MNPWATENAGLEDDGPSTVAFFELKTLLSSEKATGRVAETSLV